MNEEDLDAIFGKIETKSDVERKKLEKIKASMLKFGESREQSIAKFKSADHRVLTNEAKQILAERREISKEIKSGMAEGFSEQAAAIERIASKTRKS